MKIHRFEKENENNTNFHLTQLLNWYMYVVLPLFRQVNPPVPMPCPIRGRFYFKQVGQENELYRTRIRGITINPRHSIDCNHYVSEWKSCDQNPSLILIDAEFCETVDHTGRPISEYGRWSVGWKLLGYIVAWYGNYPRTCTCICSQLLFYLGECKVQFPLSRCPENRQGNNYKWEVWLLKPFYIHIFKLLPVTGLSKTRWYCCIPMWGETIAWQYHRLYWWRLYYWLTKRLRFRLQ